MTAEHQQQAPDSAGGGATAATVQASPPFGPAFFATVLNDRVRATCDGHPDAVPVVELHLADGLTLDLCHVPAVEALWLGVAAYRDRETCEDMDLVFVPYTMITRVTISMWHRSQRPIGFSLDVPGHIERTPTD
jgi:hypothetical protein